MKKLSQTAYKFNCCGVGSVGNQKKKKKSDFYFLKHSSLNNSVEVCRECVLLFCNALFHIHTATWICSGSSAGDLRVFSSFLCYRAATLEQFGRGVAWGEVFILSQAISVYSITVLTCCWFLFFQLWFRPLVPLVILSPSSRLSVIIAAWFSHSKLFPFALGAQ